LVQTDTNLYKPVESLI